MAGDHSKVSTSKMTTKKSSANIGIRDLPIRLLFGILCLLDYNSVLNVCLVCREWNEIISTSEKFLDTTDVNLAFNVNNCTQLTRQYRSLRIQLVDNTLLGRSFLKQINNVCDSLTHVVIQGPSTISSKDFIGFFKLSTNLTHLKMSNFSQHGSNSSNSFACLSKLQNLHLESCDWLLKHIDVRSLRTLTIECSMDNSAVVHFLNNLHRLQRLILIQRNLQADVHLTPKFRWSHLKFRNVPASVEEDFSWQRNIQKLMDVAGQNAKISIEGENDDTFSAALFNMIQCQKRITSIKIELRAFPRQFYSKRLETKFSHIKSLKLRQYDKKNETVNEFDFATLFFDEIKKLFVNVEILDIDYRASLHIVSNHKEEILTIFPKVTHLKIDDLRFCMFEYIFRMSKYVVFPSIEKLEVQNAFYMNGDYSFRAIRSTLRKLILHYRRYGVFDDIWRRNLCTFPTVKEFEVFDHTKGEKFVKTRGEIIEMLQQNASQDSRLN